MQSSKSKGKKVEFKDKEIVVEDLSEFDFSKAHIGLFSPGGKISAEYAPKAAKKRMYCYRQYLSFSNATKYSFNRS